MASSIEKPKLLKLMSSDQQLFEVEEKVAVQSKLIKHMVEDECAGNIIPLPNVNAEILTRIIKWCEKHVDKEISDPDLKQWDDNFVNVDQAILYHLLMAVNYLEISVLLDQLCEKVASMMRGKQPEEIRQIFNIKNDFTPEEEAEIRKENAWAFD